MKNQIPKYERTDNPDKVWVVAFDTICEGWNCVMTEQDGEDVICLHTEEEANADIEEMIEEFQDHSYFKVHKDVYLHNRKVIFTNKNERGESGVIEGFAPESS